MTTRAGAFNFRTIRDRLTDWHQHFGHLAADAERATMRHDLQVLLSYIRDTSVVGTSGAGNMPLKNVWTVTSRFASPPQRELKVGDLLYRPRSETDVRQLHFLRILAEISGFLRTAPSRRWNVTRQGDEFLNGEALLQCAFALAIWWHRANWLIAYPYEGMGDDLPYGFTEKTLASLLGLTPGKSVRFIEYADTLIQWTGLTWNAQESTLAGSLLQTSIEVMILRVVEGFGGAVLTYETKGPGPFPHEELTEFSITPLGRALLEATAVTGTYPPQQLSGLFPIGVN